MTGLKRSEITIGMPVEIVRKEDQRTGALTHGIKVRLASGAVGRVKKRGETNGPAMAGS
jgi:uncharacterized protein YwbE